MFGFNNNNNNNNNKTNGGSGNNNKTTYDVLTILPKWSIFCFHLRAILVALWVVTKWFFLFIWETLSQSKIISRKYGTEKRASVEYYGGLHDKPPPCLVDNRIGLQSYVKLKVKF